MAVDLRSERVRVAAYLLDGMRQGGELGDLLGCRFERRLHDLLLDQFIDDCRRRVLEAKGITRAPRGPVDGLELAELYHGAGVRIDLPDEVAFTVRPDKVETVPGRVGLQGALERPAREHGCGGRRLDGRLDAPSPPGQQRARVGDPRRHRDRRDAAAAPQRAGHAGHGRERLPSPDRDAPPGREPRPEVGLVAAIGARAVALGLGGEPAGRSREGPLRGADRSDRRRGARFARQHRRGPRLQSARRAVRDSGHLGAARTRACAVAAGSRKAGGRPRGRYRPRRSGRRRALLRRPLRACIGASHPRCGVPAAERARPRPARRRARERRRPGRGRRARGRVSSRPGECEEEARATSPDTERGRSRTGGQDEPRLHSRRAARAGRPRDRERRADPRLCRGRPGGAPCGRLGGARDGSGAARRRQPARAGLPAAAAVLRRRLAVRGRPAQERRAAR